MVKKLFILLLSCLLLWGCKADEPSVGAPSFQTTAPPVYAPEQDDSLWISYADVWEAISYDVQAIRTNGYHDGVKYPQVISIDSKADLDAYYAANRERYYLERQESIYADTIGFLDACDRYDNDFFADYSLLLILLEEGSGSIRHSVEIVERSLEGMLRVKIQRDIPQVCTDDMAQWHILLEVGKEMPKAEDVQVYLDERLAWDGRFIEPPKPEAEFKAPPKGMVRGTDAEAELTLAGFQWNYDNPDGTCTGIIADQYTRPLPDTEISHLQMDASNLERVYLPVPGESYYAPADETGYLLKFHWEKTPSYIKCTRFMGTKEETLPFELEAPFYAGIDPAIYELEAVWKDAGGDCWGKATYYFCVDTVFACG